MACCEKDSTCKDCGHEWLDFANNLIKPTNCPECNSENIQTILFFDEPKE
jgi:predicted Zn-ribbon and HTH transcriptional regulator